MNLAEQVKDLPRTGSKLDGPVAKLKPRKRQRKPSRIAAVLAQAVTWLLVSAFTGAALTVSGVWMLAGAGWALIAVGAFLFLIAGLLHVGISHG